MTNLNLQVELTNYCNLQCVECPHRVMERELQHMEPNVFDRVLYYVNKLKPSTIILHKDGEPLLHPKFWEYYRQIVLMSDAKIDLYTNGTMLTPDLVRYMADTRVHNNKLWILLTFHRHKYDGTEYDHTKIEENLLNCIELNLPNVQFVITTHQTNFTDKEASRKWYMKWANVKGTHKNIYAVHMNTAINPWAGKVDLTDGMIHFYDCPYRHADHFFIGVTGNVLPCCIDLEEEIVFGNICTDMMETILENRKNFYAKQMKRQIENPLCQKCLD